MIDFAQLDHLTSLELLGLLDRTQSSRMNGLLLGTLDLVTISKHSFVIGEVFCREIHFSNVTRTANARACSVSS